MLPWLGPQVASWPLAWRTLAYTAAWTVTALLIQGMTDIFMRVWVRNGWYTKATRDPKMSTPAMLAVGVGGHASIMVLAGFVQALVNPTPEYWDFSFPVLQLVWYHFPILLVYDAWFYFAHRYFHKNKLLYRWAHCFHHRNAAFLSVWSTGVDDPIDGIIFNALPMGVVAYLGCCVMRNYWFFFIPIHTIMNILIIGHSGCDVGVDELRDAPLMLFSPFLILQAFTANAARPVDHEWHHRDPRTNFAVFFTFWDDLMGTAWPPCPPTQHNSVPLMLLGWTFWVLTLQWLAWAMTNPLAFAAWFLLHVTLPYQLQAQPFSWIGSLVSRLRVWDFLRSQYHISYAAHDTPGSFQPQAGGKYIFAYHPQNIIARGAWYTFAGKGQGSPVAELPGCRLAVGRVLMSLPVASWAFRALGCCGSSEQELKALLLDDKAPTSVAITPDGFQQAKYAGTYSLILKKRLGFIRLAQSTGAHLVPVLGIGEPAVVGRAALCARVFKALVMYRPRPIRVVFGTPMPVAPEEDLQGVQERYISALLQLAKQHGVELVVAE